ncbi:ribonuclease 3 [Culicoides brevitarsis]|uniref:ribonuclease 3 n=1 Tax=Culicoides brevitarsis TaxID=469753 RepID=UPI00307B7A9E
MSFPWDFSKPPPGFPSVPHVDPAQATDYAQNPYYSYQSYPGYAPAPYNMGYPEPYYAPTDYQIPPPPPPGTSQLPQSVPYHDRGRSDRPERDYRRDRESHSRDYRSQSRSHKPSYERDSRSRSHRDDGYRDSRYSTDRSRHSPRSSSYRDRDSRRDRESSSSRSKDVRDDSYRHRDRSRGASIVSSSGKSSENKPQTERDRILANWRKNFCETEDDITRKLSELSQITNAKETWIRSSPADVYYKRVNDKEVTATPRLEALCDLFEEELSKRSAKAREKMEPYVPQPRKRVIKVCRHKSEKCSSSDDSDSDIDEIEDDCTMEELSRKIQHPYRLHPDLWHNEPLEMNDGPLCRCSAKSRRTGIRHGIYPGEVSYPKCDPNSNNAHKLHHYRITISPPTNFLTKTPTIIKYDMHEFLFEGFSLLSHEPIDELPTCKVIRFNIEYTILYVEEQMPENFTIRQLDLFADYVFQELLELVDFSLMPSSATPENSCPAYHFLPRYVRDLPDNGKEILAMSEVMRYLLDSATPLIDHATLNDMNNLNQHEWQDYVDYVKGMVVTRPGMRPCSIRVDQIDRNVSDLPEVAKSDDGVPFPVVVHFGIRPPQLSYAGNTEYQKAWREYVKFRHLIANMSKPSFEDKRKLEAKENKLQEMRTQGRMKRNITVVVTSKGFYRTGIMCDMVQHAMLVPVLSGHLRFHRSLNILEESIGYKFKNRYLLQLALTHPSYKENFGTNPDHARNSLTNCGIRQPEYGDRKIHYMNTRKRGINTLINIMSRFGKEYETDSNITHNERLEFLGDAVVEFLTSIHLFHMFPDLEEGGLATYRAAIVQNQHLAVLAKKLHLEEYMLYAHGSDLCHELELRHAMANCFEALMGALLLDGGIKVADKVFSFALFMENDELRATWENYPPHPLQEQEPLGDRQWIESYEMLKNLTKFEDSIGIQFRHIRLLARAFTDRSIGYTHLTLGSNQRLEFLGDTVLQLICSEYLYRHFPEHHEGHLSLLRSSLVNNKTQAVVCDDLGMTQYAVYSNPKADLKTKDRADLLEAFLGALYVDKDLEYCETFCHVCLFPRLQDFIMNQDWNDPKSKLQQCCLTLRTMDGGEPDIPVYKVTECSGPTNTRVYTVAVYFRGKRLASATGHSIQQAEMNAAKQALEDSKGLFPQLDHQKRVIARSMRKQKVPIENDTKEDKKDHRDNSSNDESSKLPMQYRKRAQTSSDDSDKSEKSDASSVKSVKKRSKRKKRRIRSPKIRVTPPNAPSDSHKMESYSSLSDNSLPSADDDDDMSIKKSDIKQMEKDLCELNDSTSNVAIGKVEGTEELSSDAESGEIF